MTEPRKVYMSDELFAQLGASKVDWHEPDADGFYTPTVYAATGDSGGLGLDVERLARALHDEYAGKDSEFGGELCGHREDAERVAARLREDAP